MDAALLADLEGHSPTVFTAMKLTLSIGPLRLVTGGTVVVEGETYIPHHSEFGSLDSAEPVEDGADGQASRCTVVLLPDTDAAIATLVDPTEQDAPIIIYQGTVNPVTGAVVGYEVLFEGELDFPHLSVGADTRSVSLECGTEEGRLLEPNEERRLSDSNHKAIWGAAERGLENVTSVQKKVYWRASDPASDAVSKGVLDRVFR